MKREALRASPKFADEVPDLLKYVQHSAGPDGAFVHELVSYQKTLKKPRVVQGKVMAAVATTPLGDDGYGCIKFRQDLIKAMVGASDRYTHNDGSQCLIDIPVIQRLGKTSQKW